LTIIASAIAVGQAGDRLISLLSKLRRLKEAPAEVDHLIGEVTQAKKTISNLQSTVLKVAQNVIDINLEPLQALLCRYAALLGEMEAFIEKYLTKSAKVAGEESELVVLRFGWAMKKQKVEALHSKIRDIRLLIVGELSSIQS
jgi:predicted RNase H-like nuclease (RuvC/YqgF family)